MAILFGTIDSTGGYDLDKEQKEEEEKRKLFMQSKMLETLDSTKYTLAREFYTEVIFEWV
jgi:hypothetical protein